jgi:hypothetical protein
MSEEVAKVIKDSVEGEVKRNAATEQENLGRLLLTKVLYRVSGCCNFTTGTTRDCIDGDSEWFRF